MKDHKKHGDCSESSDDSSDVECMRRSSSKRGGDYYKAVAVNDNYQPACSSSKNTTSTTNTTSSSSKITGCTKNSSSTKNTASPRNSLDDGKGSYMVGRHMKNSKIQMNDCEDYDPYDHRIVKNPISTDEAFLSMVKCGIGTGCLAMPMAFSKSGWALGIVSSIVIGVITVYCLHMLIKCNYKLCQLLRVPQLSYAKAMYHGLAQGPTLLRCFSVPARCLVDFTMASYHFGVCCVYAMFIAENMKQVVDYYTTLSLDSRLYICALTGPLIWLVLVRDLKNLMPYTATANLLFFIGFVSTVGFLVSGLPPLSEREAVGSIEQFPIFFGTMLFAIESVGVVIAIEQNMLEPREFLGCTGVLNRGMTMVLCIYTTFGFLGYWRYGPTVADSVTLNLPLHSIVSQLIKIAFAISIYLSYALQGYVTIDVIRSHLIDSLEGSRQKLVDYAIRLLLVFASVFFAVNVPNLGPLLSLVGASCLSLLCLIFPAILDICVSYTCGYGPCGIKLFKDFIILGFGVVGGYYGSEIALNQLSNTFTFVF